MNAIKASWNGQERLWKVFWIYNWLFGIAIGLASEAAESALPRPVSLAVSVFGLAWAVWVTVSLWRCAFNADWRGWGYVVRAIVVLAVIATAVLIAALFLGAGFA
jgi:hypothetical protein